MIETSSRIPKHTLLLIVVAALGYFVDIYDLVLFGVVKAVLVGKPQDEQFYEEYKEAWLAVTKEYNLPIIYNMNFGHAAPRCILPYGGQVRVDFDQARVYMLEPLVA